MPEIFDTRTDTPITYFFTNSTDSWAALPALICLRLLGFHIQILFSLAFAHCSSQLFWLFWMLWFSYLCAAWDGQILQPPSSHLTVAAWNAHVPEIIAGTALVIAFLGRGSSLSKICIFLNCSSTCLNFPAHPQLFSVISLCNFGKKKKKNTQTKNTKKLVKQLIKTPLLCSRHF